jgi:3-oxoacyl-[acyl-carrier-protein] synthase-3
LNIAAQMVRTGAVGNALVIGAETLSRLVDWKDRNTCILFGDGAGAFVLQASDVPGGVLSAVMRSDGSGGDSLSVPAGGSRYPASAATVADGMHYIHMNGREVFRFATRVMSQATQEAVRLAKLQMDDIRLIIPHQANQRIIEAAARQLDIPMDRVMVNVGSYGNTSTASIPIATCEAIQAGRLESGDKVVFVGFGAGLTWGAAVVQWSGPILERRKRRIPKSYRVWAKVRSFLRRMLRHVEGWIWGRLE